MAEESQATEADKEAGKSPPAKDIPGQSTPSPSSRSRPAEGQNGAPARELEEAKENQKISPSSRSRPAEGQNGAPARAKKDYEPGRRRFENSEMRGPGGGGGRFRQQRRVLDTRKLTIDYKKSVILERFISKTGKILPRRVTGATALVQRKIAREIKRSRHIGLLPYSDR